MSVIPRQIIEQLVESKRIIEPFDKKLLQPASVDLRLGRRVLESPVGNKRGAVIDLDEKNKSIQISSGQFISVLTLERLDLPLNICGRVGLRSFYARKGLISFHGTQVDPGFKGHLVVPLVNVGPETICLEYGEPICTLELNNLETDSDKAYSGDYQNLTDFPADDINFMLRAHTVSLAEIPEIRLSVHELKKSFSEKQPRFKALFSLILFGFFGITTVVSWRFFEPWVAIASFGVSLTALLAFISSYFETSKKEGIPSG